MIWPDFLFVSVPQDTDAKPTNTSEGNENEQNLPNQRVLGNYERLRTILFNP